MHRRKQVANSKLVSSYSGEVLCLTLMGEDTVRILSPMLLMMASRPSNEDRLMGNRAPLTGHEF